MKAKVSRGGGIRGMLNYALDQGPKRSGDKQAEMVGGNMSGKDARSLAAEFGVSRAMRPECSRPVWHCSLSLPQGETLDPDKWDQVSRAFMEKMGLDPDNHQYIAARHRDTDYDHIHIVTSRIDLSGKIWHGKWEARKAIKATQELEREMRLQITPGLEQTTQDKKLTSNEIQMSARTMEAPPRAVLQNLIKEELKNNPTTEQFIDRLEVAGVQIRPNIASTGRVSGLAFEYNGVAFKGSQLGKRFSWAGLQKQGLDYEQDRDGAALSEAKKRFDNRQNRTTDTGPGQSSGDYRPGDQRPGTTRDRDPEGIERAGDQVRPLGETGHVRGRDPESRYRGNENHQNAGTPRGTGKKEHGQPYKNRRDNGLDNRVGLRGAGGKLHNIFTGNKGVDMIRKTIDNANEITGFKREISLLDYAGTRGFLLDKRKSSRRTAVLRRENEKIAISLNNNGHWIYADLKDGLKGGSIIDFVQRETGFNLGQVRKELRQFSSSGVCLHEHKLVRQMSKEAQAKILESEKTKAFPLKDPEYLHSRGISKFILNDLRFVGRISQDHRGNICFPHENDQGFSGYEKKNRGFTGFSEGGEKGIWFSRPQGDENKLVFVESAIDALSHAQLHPGNKAIYLSLGGQFTVEQEALVRRIMKKNPDKKRVLAFDNDEQGRKYVKDFRRLAKDLPVSTDVPQAKDWNAELITLLANHKKQEQRLKRPSFTSGSQKKHVHGHTHERGRPDLPGSAQDRLRKQREKNKNRNRGPGR